MCQALPSSGGIVATDALGGYRLDLDPTKPNEVVFRKNLRHADHYLPPGRKKPLGWLRFKNAINDPDHELSITIH